jgi:glycine dehydrogenase subunit 1
LGYAKNGLLDRDELSKKLDGGVAAVIVQSPNFFGLLEQLDEIGVMVAAKGALLVVVFTEAVALGLIEAPKQADIVVGELQSFAVSPSYGGPFAGIIASKEKYIRQLPGRLVGETLDADGHRAFCLTLATREQHIRREKATSNICTNQALLALMATVFMTIYGKRGLRELAEQNLAKAHYLASGLDLPFEAPFFNEFVARAKGTTPERVNAALLERKIIGGLPLERFYPELKDSMLLCATEMNKREDMDVVATAFAGGK